SPTYYFPPHSRVGSLDEVLDALAGPSPTGEANRRSREDSDAGRNRLRRMIHNDVWAAMEDDSTGSGDFSTDEGRSEMGFRIREGVSRDPAQQHPALRTRVAGRSRTGGPMRTRTTQHRPGQQGHYAQSPQTDDRRGRRREESIERARSELRLAEQEYDAFRLGERSLQGELPLLDSYSDRGPALRNQLREAQRVGDQDEIERIEEILKDPNLSDRHYLDNLEGRELSEPLDPEDAANILNTPHPGLYDDRNTYAESGFDFPSVARTDEELHDRAMEDREFQEGPPSEEAIALDAEVDAAIAASEADEAEDERRREERREQQRRELEPRHPPASEGFERPGGRRGDGWASQRSPSGESEFPAKSSFFRIIYDPLRKEIAEADNSSTRNALQKLKNSFEKDSKRSFRYGPRHPHQLDAGVLKIDDDDLFDVIDALAEVLGKWARGADGDAATRQQELLDYLRAIEESGGARQDGDTSREFMLPIRIAAVTKLIDMLTERAMDLF
ncbi:MAG: hypothetical protein VX222_01030, partial [Actinomycetota bacterium]|nr:hypothetical protein [Actinomycetota bacterium]